MLPPVHPAAHLFAWALTDDEHMTESTLSQKARFILLLCDVAIICGASWLAFGRVIPVNGDKGFWFYTALLGLLFGSRLATPFFAKPADVILYAAPAALSLALVNSWPSWDEGTRVAFCIAMVFCVISGLVGSVAVLTFNTKSSSWQRASNTARILAETLGAPRVIFSVVIAFALFAFHRSSPRELGLIAAAWVLTTLLSPLEGAFRLSFRLKHIFNRSAILGEDGEVVAYQTPGLILIRQSESGEIEPGALVAVKDPLKKTRFALVLDQVGRDEGILLRALEIADTEKSSELSGKLAPLVSNAVASIREPGEMLAKNPLVKSKNALVGLVAPETSIERLYFEVVQDVGLEEGRLVEIWIGQRLVTYQIVNGLTKEEIVQQKNTYGYARAQAQKIGEWDAPSKRFVLAKWLPVPNAPVFLKTSTDFTPDVSAIGYFPGTDYPVAIKNIDELVTHNTAILGILGVGKSMLAIELVERMMAAGIKVICIDLTDQYSKELAVYIDAAQESVEIAALQRIGAAGKGNVHQNVEDGGSRKDFSEAIGRNIQSFLHPNDPRRLKIFNPAHFEVWRQDSRPFNNNASMASLSPAEITHIISQATLDSASALGMTDKARVCLVYEEAHSLVPEWNSTVTDGDKSASNGTARAILQGRKYGLGCVLISQRTANVTKTILNQCNTIFAMRTFDDTGKTFLANYIGTDYANSLPSLSERQAVFFGRASNCENPILIRLNDRARFVGAFRTQHPPPSRLGNEAADGGDGKK